MLRALPLLPPADWALEIGVDACRTSVQPIFEAIACENPFPADASLSRTSTRWC